MKTPRKPTVILLVDDEPNTLLALKRNLYVDQNSPIWQIQVASSGAEALEYLSMNQVDILVSDIRMPHMDGLSLLKAVSKKYPDVTRIILSNYLTREIVFQSTGLAHQYIHKGAENIDLRAVLAQISELHQLIHEDKLKQLLSRLETIPSLPTIYNQLVTLLQDPNSSVQEVGKIISQDVGMVAKILQLVNSAYFGLPNRIVDPRQAAVYLGLDNIRSLVLTIHIFSQFNDRSLTGITLEGLQSHSVEVGTLAKRITAFEGGDKRTIDHAFAAGLLHDIGKLILMANLPQEYQQAQQLTEQFGIEMPIAELDVFGATHAQVGAYLLGLWGLPYPVVEAVALHHNPTQIKCANHTFSPLTAVHAGNAIIHQLKQPDDSGVLSELDEDYLEALGLSEHLAQWISLCEKASAASTNTPD